MSFNCALTDRELNDMDEFKDFNDTTMDAYIIYEDHENSNNLGEEYDYLDEHDNVIGYEKLDHSETMIGGGSYAKLSALDIYSIMYIINKTDYLILKHME